MNKTYKVNEEQNSKALNNSGSKTGSKKHNKKKILKRLSNYFIPYKLSFFSIFIATTLSCVMSIFTPKLLGNATTSIYESLKSNQSIDFEKLTEILIFLIVLNILSAILLIFAQYYISIYSQKIIFDIRMDINNKLEKLPLKYYDSNHFGDIISRISNDVDSISNTLKNTLTQLISSTVIVIGVIYMMFSINICLTLIAILTLPLSIISVKTIGKKSREHFKEEKKLHGDINSEVEESIAAFTTIKSFNKEASCIEEFEAINIKLREVSMKGSFLGNSIMPIMTIISNFGYVIVSVAGALFFIKGILTIGNIQAFLQYTRQFGRPISRLGASITNMQSSIAAAERIFELLDEDELKEDSKEENSKIRDGNINFNHIQFGYDEKTLMKDISLEVKSGENIAIIGPTGAGKTTLVNLLMRFYDVKGGSIRIDGVNINDISREELRSNFGMVLQDTWLFRGSIYENIAYSKTDASRDEVIEAAKIAKAHHFIMTQKNGYDTIINEEGNNISAGEKQLITIARAVLSNPKILILDEATSSVDSRTEVLIKKGLDNLSKGKTTFVIAHRLSTIKNADRVILMNNGNIEKIGTYSEVVKKQEIV